MTPIFGRTREDAWFKAVKHLLETDDNLEYNLILEVGEPTKTDDRSLAISESVDALLRSADMYPLNTVADTIFPAAEYKKRGMDGVFQTYPEEIYPAIKCVNVNGRGTYAYRLVRGYRPDGTTCNPLEGVLNRLKSQIQSANGKRFAFEVSLEDVESIPINRNDTNLMAFPCLSHLSFKLNRDRTAINLTAIYRSQYFISKALGNLLGLARLQHCLARELGISVGVLVCHATSAKLDMEGMSKKIRTFISDIEGRFDASK